MPELLAALGIRGRLTRIELEPLDPPELQTLVERLTGAPLDPSDVAWLHEQTGGNPLFVVETVRAGWRPGSPTAPVSPRVQAVIEARLANLSPTGRELVAAGAVIGRAFDTELLAAVAGGSGDDDALLSGLDELWQHGIIRARDHGGSAGSYDFSHGTLRDVAAAALSPVRRTLLHRRVALALQLRAGESGTGSAEIAAHYAQAGDPAQAAEWYRRAAEAAQSLYAHADAVGLLQRALELVAVARSQPPATPRNWSCGPPCSPRWCRSRGTRRRECPGCSSAPSR